MIMTRCLGRCPSLRNTVFFFAGCVLLLIPALSSSQDKAYRIGADDVIRLVIYAGGEKQHEAELTVSGDGTINAPFVGVVKAAGLTTSRLEETLREPLARDYFVDPKVNIQIAEYHSLKYYISGAVKTPGLYEVTSEASLLELIAKAGGVAEERGNIAYILRNSTEEVASGKEVSDLAAESEPIKVDLQRLLDMGDMSVNVMLESGDVVYIPPAKSLDQAVSKIFVEGEVVKPGLYDYQPGLTAMNAVVMAGGFDRFAAPNRARIIRKTDGEVEVIKVNLDDVREGKTEDVFLTPGDRIYVPETWW